MVHLNPDLSDSKVSGCRLNKENNVGEVRKASYPGFKTVQEQAIVLTLQTEIQPCGWKVQASLGSLP